MTPNNKPDLPLLRRFGLIMAGSLSGLFGIFLPWWHSARSPLWPWIAAALFAIVGLTLPAVLAPIFKYWMKLGAVLGWINSRIILSIVYYVLILPIGIILRLSGSDPMQRKFDRQLPTYRKPSQQAAKEQLERIF